MCGDIKVNRAYAGDVKIYSSGNVVTYYVDAGVYYQEEVEEGVSCLSPKTFVPKKSGWTFVGWRTDSTANGTVLTSKVMGDAPITLYAVFRKSVTVTYYNGSTTASSTSGYRYYNNGNFVNPTFTLTPASLPGWTFRGWATSSAATAGIAYSSISNTAFAASATVYAAYSQTITLSYNGNGNTGGSTASQTGARYYNTGNYSNPSFTLATNGFSKTNYAFQKWAQESASGTQYSAGASVTLSANTIFYAVWKVAEKTIWNGTSLASGIGLAGSWDGAGKLLSYCSAVGDEDGGEEVAKQVSITGIDLTGYSTLTVTSTASTSCAFGTAYAKFGIDTADKIFFNLPQGTSNNIRTETGTIDVSGHSGVHSLVFYQYAHSDSTYYGHLSSADIDIKQIVLK